MQSCSGGQGAASFVGVSFGLRRSRDDLLVNNRAGSREIPHHLQQTAPVCHRTSMTESMRVPLTCAFLLGVAGGARTMLPAAAVSRAVRAGSVRIEGTPLRFLEGRNLNRILVGLAVAEMVADKLPMTPSRKHVAAFTARAISGALAGVAVGAASRRASLGLLLGMAGAIVGTEGGAAFRSWLSSLFKRDLPAAVIEDLVALALIGYVSSKLNACGLPETVA